MNPFIKVTWQDVPENFTPEKIKRVKTYFQNKYNSTSVQIITKTLSNVQNTRLQSLEVSDNILDSQYQKTLMKIFQVIAELIIRIRRFLILINILQSSIQIENYILSCRVLGRGIESKFWNLVLEEIKKDYESS